MEDYKKIWTEGDIKIMSWHDSRVYGINFNSVDYCIELNVDYIFEWNLNEDKSAYDKFLVAPALLSFSDYSDLEIHIPWGQTYDVIINEIKRGKSVPAPNNKVNMTEYEIILETGYIKLQATGFKMNLLAQPVLIKTQDIDVNMRKRLINEAIINA